MDRLSRPGAGAPTDAGAADTQPAGTRALARGIEAVVLVALLALAVVARRPDYLLSHSFWLDEGWVIDSVRAPLRQIGLMTTSTPVGWTLLLRAVPPLGGPERYRLLPLAFAVATVVLAWLLARRLGRLGVLRAVVAAACLALLPASLARHDLKQYTAEGFVAVGVVLLVVWIEERWSGRRLALLASLGAASILIANAAPMLALAGLGALTLTAAGRRDWRRAGEAAVAAAAVAAVHLLVYLRIAGAGDNPSMRSWWLADYIHLDGGLAAAARFAGGRAVASLESIGFGPWWLTLMLIAVGVWALARAGRPAAALLLPLLAVEVVAAGVAQRYPFLEARTSLFVAVTLGLYAALGIGELLVLLLDRAWTAPVAAGATVCAAALLFPAAQQAAMEPMPSAHVREQLAVVEANWHEGDAVVVNSGGSFPFAYYWPQRPTFVRTTQDTALNFMVTYPDHPNLVMVRGGGTTGLVPALEQARANGGRIWVVFAHGSPATIRDWTRAAARFGRIAHPGTTSLPLLVRPPRSGPRMSG